MLLAAPVQKLLAERFRERTAPAPTCLLVRGRDGERDARRPRALIADRAKVRPEVDALAHTA